MRWNVNSLKDNSEEDRLQTNPNIRVNKVLDIVKEWNKTFIGTIRVIEYDYCNTYGPDFLARTTFYHYDNSLKVIIQNQCHQSTTFIESYYLFLEVTCFISKATCWFKQKENISTKHSANKGNISFLKKLGGSNQF